MYSTASLVYVIIHLSLHVLQHNRLAMTSSMHKITKQCTHMFRWKSQKKELVMKDLSVLWLKL